MLTFGGNRCTNICETIFQSKQITSMKIMKAGMNMEINKTNKQETQQKHNKMEIKRKKKLTNETTKTIFK